MMMMKRSFAAARMAQSSRAVPVFGARFLSGEPAKAPPAPKYLTLEQSKALEMNGTVGYLDNPLFADLQQSPSPEGAMINAEGVGSLMPKNIADTLMVRIYRPAKNVMQAGKGDRFWAFEPEHNNERWVNMIQGYWSGGDPLGPSGLKTMQFNTMEQAMNFCKRQGWNYYIDEPLENEHVSQEGKKLYAANFLNYHVRARRARLTTKEFAEFQFKHAERGNTCWVNLKHTHFGAAASKTVSGTQWSDPHPKNHAAKNWHMKSLVAKQELARRLGK